VVAGCGAGHFVLKLWGSVLGESTLFQEALKRGSAHAWCGRWEQAVQEYRLALRESPKDPSAKTYLAMALFKSGQFGEALDLYQELWKGQPSNLAILQRLAEVQDALGDSASALANYRLVAESSARRRQPAESLRGWRKASELNPSDPALWDSLMEAAALVGALADYMPGYLRLAREIAMGGRFQDAIQVVERAQKLDPGNPAVPALLSAIRKVQEFSRLAAAAGETVPEETLARWFAATTLESAPRQGVQTPVVEEPQQQVGMLETPNPECGVEPSPPMDDQALECDAGLVDALLPRAQLLSRVGRWGAAEEQCRKLLNDSLSSSAAEPAMESVGALLEIAREKAAEGEMAAATESLVWLRSRVARPQLPSSMAERAAATSAELLGRCGGEHLEEIALLPLELQDEVVQGLKRAEDLAMRGQLRSAADGIYELIAKYPDFLPFQSLLGRVLAAQGRQDEARGRSGRLAVLYDMRGTPQNGLELLWWQVADGVGDEDARAGLAEALRAQNRLAEAEAVLAGLWPQRWGAGLVESTHDVAALPGPVGDPSRSAEASFAGGDPEEATRR